MHPKPVGSGESPPTPYVVLRSPLTLFRLGFRFLTSRSHLSWALQTSASEIALYFAEFERLAPEAARPSLIANPDGIKARYLYTICRVLRPERVIETGVSRGVSSTGILLALRENGCGMLDSIDLPGASYVTESKTRWTDISDSNGPGWTIPTELRDRWRLHIGASRDILPTVVRKAPNLGLFYHDSEHTLDNMEFEMEVVWPLLSAGGVLAVDNANWSTAVFRFRSRHPAAQCANLYPFFSILRRD